MLTKEEADIVSIDTLHSPGLSSLRDSGYSEDGMSSIDLPYSVDAKSHPTESFETAPDTISQDMACDLEANRNIALANEAFKTLRAQQKEQFQRVSQFEQIQRKALSAHHQWALNRLTTQFEASTADKTKQVRLNFAMLSSHLSRLTHSSMRSNSNDWTNFKFLQSMTCASRMPRRRRT